MSTQPPVQPATQPAADTSRSQGWTSIIQTVQTPLGFFVLIVLIAEAIMLLTLNSAVGDERTILIVSMIAALFLLVLIVAVTSWFRPEALKGQRPLLPHAAPANIVRDVQVVEDSPLSGSIDFTKPVARNITDIFQVSVAAYSDDSKYKRFLKSFAPMQMVFVSTKEYKNFRPTIVISTGPNELVSAKMTVEEYLDQLFLTLKEMQFAKGERQLRVSHDFGVMWYMFSLPNPTEDDPEHTEEIYQLFKTVVTGDKLATLAVTYHPVETDPEDIQVLQTLIEEFGTKPS